MENIENIVKNIISEQLSIKKEDILNDSTFSEDLGADSLDTVELIMSLEEEFDIEISDDEAEKITTVQKAIDLIKEKKEEKNI